MPFPLGNAATYVITDTNTGSQVTLRLYDSGTDPSGGDTDSPTPTKESMELKRAIIVHPVPQVDYNVAQDMGLSEAKKTIEAYCQYAVLQALIGFAKLPQYTTTTPAGRMAITSTRRDGVQDENIPSCAVESLTYSCREGTVIWYKVAMTFLIVSPNQ
jgi:hypothetical protein